MRQLGILPKADWRTSVWRAAFAVEMPNDGALRQYSAPSAPVLQPQAGWRKSGRKQQDGATRPSSKVFLIVPCHTSEITVRGLLLLAALYLLRLAPGRH